MYRSAIRSGIQTDGLMMVKLYQGNGRGVIDHICAQHRHTLAHSHQVSKIIIDLDGDRAGSESYVTAALRVRRGEQLKQITVWGRYIDQWSRRGGRWGLDSRISVRDFDEIRDVTALSEHDIGRRDRSDPSYAVLGNPAGSNHESGLLVEESNPCRRSARPGSCARTGVGAHSYVAACARPMRISSTSAAKWWKSRARYGGPYSSLDLNQGDRPRP